jgi:hypothetical protein
MVGVGVSSAASNTATTLVPLDDGTPLETRAVLDCHRATGSCDFTVGADLRAGDGEHHLAEHLRTDDLFLSDRCAALSTRLEKSDHRSDAAVIVSGLGQVQLAQNASHVLLDGAFGEPQLMGNAGVGAPLCHQRQNLVFPRTEGSKRICALAS